MKIKEAKRRELVIVSNWVKDKEVADRYHYWCPRCDEEKRVSGSHKASWSCDDHRVALIDKDELDEAWYGDDDGDILSVCPHCNEEEYYDYDLVGDVINCPYCEKDFILATKEHLKARKDYATKTDWQTIPREKFQHGQNFIGVFRGEQEVRGTVSIYNDKVYLCHDYEKADGGKPRQMFGHKYGWIILGKPSASWHSESSEWTSLILLGTVKPNEIPFEDFKHGQVFTAIYKEKEVTGRVSIDEDEGMAYLCQDVAEGSSTDEQFGYKYGYAIATDEQSYDPTTNYMKNLVLHDAGIIITAQEKHVEEVTMRGLTAPSEE